MHKIIRIAISLILIITVLYKINFKQLITTISNVEARYLFYIFTLILLGTLVNGLRIWFYIQRYLNHKITYFDNFKVYLASILLNYAFIGGLGGEIYKVYYLTKQSIKKAKSIKMILIEKINVLFAVSILIAFNCFIFFPKHILLYLIFIAVVIYISYRLYSFFNKKIFSVSQSLNLINLGICLVAQLIFIIAIFLASLSIKSDISYSTFSQLSLIFLISNIMAFLPISIGGIGVREWTFYYGANFFQINIDLAIAICVIFFAGSMLVSFTGILPLIRYKKQCLQ